MEGCITHGPENAIHRRLSARLAGDHRAVRPLRHGPSTRSGASIVIAGVLTESAAEVTSFTKSTLPWHQPKRWIDPRGE